MDKTLALGQSEEMFLASLVQPSSVTTCGDTFNYNPGSVSNCLAIQYPYYYNHWCTHTDTFQKAFNIAQKLIEKKLVRFRSIKIITMDDFVNLVNEIQTILDK